MIKESCFTREWLESFRKRPEHRRIDRIILEKMIYALHLLERLKANGLDFVLKGGTGLLFLLDEGNRFSIDVDIICSAGREKLEYLLKKVVETSRFREYILDQERSYRPGVPKAHYAFAFDSVIHTRYSGKILLDILFTDPVYPELTEKSLETKWIETESKTVVTLPSIESITGDKLTAFAPGTIGIPYFKGGQPFAMEICKQLFDLSRLFEKIQRMDTLAAGFHAVATQEIQFRKSSNSGISISPDEVLTDIIATCVVLAKRGSGTPDEKLKFNELQKGIKAFGTGYLMTGKFRIDDAVAASAKVAYLAAKILTNDLTPIERYEGQDIKRLNIKEPEWNFLNRLKRQPDKSAFYYWYKAVQLFTESR